MVAPWTQAVSISWRPTLRFYEQQIPILRDLEDQGVLKAFAVSQDRISGRLLERGHQLSVDRRGVQLKLLGPGAEIESLWGFVCAAVDRLAPISPRRVTVDIQYIIEIDAPFHDAVAAAEAGLLAVPTGIVDFALLLDMQPAPDVEARLEVGIIRADEAPERLEREVGRIRQGMPQAVPSAPGPGWSAAEFPPVALFVDSKWRRDLQTDESLDAILDFYRNTLQQASDVVEGLHSKLLQGNNRKGMLGS